METQYQRSWVPPIKNANCSPVDTAREAFNRTALTWTRHIIQINKNKNKNKKGRKMSYCYMKLYMDLTGTFI